MRTLLRRPLGRTGTDVVVAATERDDGDFHPLRTAPATLAQRQRSATGLEWVMVDQVHGVGVHTLARRVDAADAISTARSATADVLVASCPDIPLAVWAADCAPLVLLGRRGTVVAVHAGWRGLAAGIVHVAIGEVEADDDEVVAAVLGPVIHPCCYPFGAAELERVAAGVRTPPERIVAITATGAPALDIPAAVALALGHHDIGLDTVASCTGCDGRWFSHRRGDTARHAIVVWRDAEGADRGR